MSIKPLSLEQQYSSLALQVVNPERKINDRDFIAPNEGSPWGIARHLTQLKKGIGVGCGLERLFFAVLYSEESWCEGWVGRDHNPRIKACGDFNLLLLKITTFSEYEALSSPIQSFAEMNERLDTIKAKILSSTLPESFKEHYLKILQSYGKVYFTLDREKSWRQNEAFRACWYPKNEQQFAKLQRYALAGNIIFTVGVINDLQFLQERVVSVVDTSNIHDFSPICLQGGSHFSPRIIWVDQNCKQTKFYSMEYQVGNKCQLCESPYMQPMLPIMMKDMRAYGVDRYFEYTQVKGWEDEFEKQCYGDPCYLIGFLDMLRCVPGGRAAFEQAFGKARLTKVKAKVAALTFYHETLWNVNHAIKANPGLYRAGVATLVLGLGMGSYFLYHVYGQESHQ